MLKNIHFPILVSLILFVQSLSFAQQSEKLSLKLGFEASYMNKNNNSSTFSSALNQAKDTVFFESINANGDTKEYSGAMNIDLLYKFNERNAFSFSFSHLQLSNQSNLFTSQTRIDSSFANRLTTSYKAEDFYKVKTVLRDFLLVILLILIIKERFYPLDLTEVFLIQRAKEIILGFMIIQRRFIGILTDLMLLNPRIMILL